MKTVVGFETPLVADGAGIASLVVRTPHGFETLSTPLRSIAQSEFERLVASKMVEPFEETFEVGGDDAVLVYVPERLWHPHDYPFPFFLLERMRFSSVAPRYLGSGLLGFVTSRSIARDLLRLLVEEVLGFGRLSGARFGGRVFNLRTYRLFLRTASAALGDSSLRERVFALLLTDATENNFEALLTDAALEFDDAALERIKRDASQLRREEDGDSIAAK